MNLACTDSMLPFSDVISEEEEEEEEAPLGSSLRGVEVADGRELEREKRGWGSGSPPQPFTEVYLKGPGWFIAQQFLHTQRANDLLIWSVENLFKMFTNLQALLHSGCIMMLQRYLKRMWVCRIVMLVAVPDDFGEDSAAALLNEPLGTGKEAGRGGREDGKNGIR